MELSVAGAVGGVGGGNPHGVPMRTLILSSGLLAAALMAAQPAFAQSQQPLGGGGDQQRPGVAEPGTSGAAAQDGAQQPAPRRRRRHAAARGAEPGTSGAAPGCGRATSRSAAAAASNSPNAASELHRLQPRKRCRGPPRSSGPRRSSPSPRPASAEESWDTAAVILRSNRNDTAEQERSRRLDRCAESGEQFQIRGNSHAQPIASSTLAAAALLAASVLASAQTPMGDAPFCLKSAAGPTSCIFRTMAACEQSKLAASADQCVEKSRSAEPPAPAAGCRPAAWTRRAAAGRTAWTACPRPRGSSSRDLHVFEVAGLVVDADARRRDPARELAGLDHLTSSGSG